MPVPDAIDFSRTQKPSLRSGARQQIGVPPRQIDPRPEDFQRCVRRDTRLRGSRITRRGLDWADMFHVKHPSLRLARDRPKAPELHRCNSLVVQDDHSPGGLHALAFAVHAGHRRHGIVDDLALKRRHRSQLLTLP